jgi:hypothetical protein
LDLGFIYHSKAILSENNQNLSVSPSVYVPTTLPGSRAPYVQLLKNGKKISTLDLFEKDMVLLVAAKGQPWQKAANDLIHSLSIPLKSFRIADDGDLSDPEDIWLTKYEISETGAVLVRPDGHVAWRSNSLVDNPKDVLNKVLNIVLVKVAPYAVKLINNEKKINKSPHSIIYKSFMYYFLYYTLGFFYGKIKSFNFLMSYLCKTSPNHP